MPLTDQELSILVDEGTEVDAIRLRTDPDASPSRALELQDGDMLVLSFPGTVNSVTYDRMHAQLSEVIRERLGVKVSVLILAEGGKLEGAIRAATTDEDG